MLRGGTAASSGTQGPLSLRGPLALAQSPQPRPWPQPQPQPQQVRRNRLFVAHSYDPYQAPRRKGSLKRGDSIVWPAPRKSKWSLDDSIWKPRKKTGNSKDYYETPKALRATFDTDWDHAVRPRLRQSSSPWPLAPRPRALPSQLKSPFRSKGARPRPHP